MLFIYNSLKNIPLFSHSVFQVLSDFSFIPAFLSFERSKPVISHHSRIWSVKLPIRTLIGHFEYSRIVYLYFTTSFNSRRYGNNE